MGSFYSTCSVSHMTLTNQRTSIQLLVPTYKPDFKEHMGMMVFNEGAQGFFSPFAFPIHGKYDDYGYLHDIKEDKNTKMLEEFFNLSIDQILQNVGDDRWSRYGEKENDSSFKIQNEDGTPMKNQEVFRNLGMTYIRTEILEHLETGWEKYIPIDVKQKQYSGKQMIFNLIKTLKTHTPHKPKKRSKKILEKFTKGISFGDYTEAETKDLLNSVQYHSDYRWNHDNCYIPSLVKHNMYSLLPITTEYKNDVCKQYQMIISLSKLQRILLPSIYGGQYENHTATTELNELSNKLMEIDVINNLKSYLEDYTKYSNGMTIEEHFEDYGMLNDYNKFKHLL